MLRRFLLWVLRDDLVKETRLVEIETEWNELLTKMAAAVAREAKAKKRAVRKALDGETTHAPTPTPPMNRKAALRQRAASMWGVRVPAGIQPGGTNESSSQNG